MTTPRRMTVADLEIRLDEVLATIGPDTTVEQIATTNYNTTMTYAPSDEGVKILAFLAAAAFRRLADENSRLAILRERYPESGR